VKWSKEKQRKEEWQSLMKWIYIYEMDICIYIYGMDIYSEKKEGPKQTTKTEKK